MEYTEVSIKIEPFSEQNAEIITALLADIGFDSFTNEPNSLEAYIPTKHFNNEIIDGVLKNSSLPFKTSYSVTKIEDQNWNKQWESNFKPISIENLCHIRAPFHQSQKNFKVEVVIEPKMAFGTGHHQTTWLMIRELFKHDLKSKSLLDMGCGTGILAIVAEKLGASPITAIDNDEWAYNNTKENIVANQCENIKAMHGDAHLLKGKRYQVILANINLNILISDMPKYVQCLVPKGILVMSGILTDDVKALSNKAKKLDLTVKSIETKDNWALISTEKS